MDDIQKAIAKVGHDAGKHKASDEVYDRLPGCCKYERLIKNETHDKKEHNHEGHS